MQNVILLQKSKRNFSLYIYRKWIIEVLFLISFFHFEINYSFMNRITLCKSLKHVAGLRENNIYFLASVIQCAKNDTSMSKF